MGILDKIRGRAKQAAGDLTDDPALRREGLAEERKGEAKDERGHSQELPVNRRHEHTRTSETQQNSTAR